LDWPGDDKDTVVKVRGKESTLFGSNKNAGSGQEKEEEDRIEAGPSDWAKKSGN
jgi:hypothetical protein